MNLRRPVRARRIEATRRSVGRRVVAAFLLALPLGAGGCATLRQVAALGDVEFALDRVGEVELAGVRIGDRRSFADLSLGEAARITAAVASGAVPFSFAAHVGAENPATNSVSARLMQMRWTAVVDDRDTVSGVLDREYVLPPGQRVDIPLRVEMDLYDFFGGRAAEFFRIARAVSGGGEPARVSLRARPTVQTPLGPIQYPNDITIVSRTLGG